MRRKLCKVLTLRELKMYSHSSWAWTDTWKAAAIKLQTRKFSPALSKQNRAPRRSAHKWIEICQHRGASWQIAKIPGKTKTYRYTLPPLWAKSKGCTEAEPPAGNAQNHFHIATIRTANIIETPGEKWKNLSIPKSELMIVAQSAKRYGDLLQTWSSMKLQSKKARSKSRFLEW